MDGRGDIKVSVLMLVYNQAQWVDSAIQGAINQRAPFAIEIVIGDDHSTDDTLEHCRQWQLKYGSDRVVILTSEQNRGIQANFLRTLDACRGEYVAICEGDDFWIDKSKLRRQVAFLDANPDYVTSIHRVLNWYEDDRSQSLSNGGRQKRDCDILDLARCNFISNVSSVWRRGLCTANLKAILDPKRDALTVDYAVHMLNAQYGKIHYSPRTMAVYRKYGKSVWSCARPDRQYLMAMNVRRVLMAHFCQSRPDVHALLAKAYVDNAVALMRYYRSAGEEDKNAAIITEVLAAVADTPSQDTFTASYIERRLNAPAQKPSISDRAFRVLKNVRRLLSRLLPSPRPC